MFELQTRPTADGIILDLQGALGKEGGEAVLSAVQAITPPPQRLVLNFSAAGPINTAGLGGVLWAVRLVTRAGGIVTAYGLSEHFRKVCHVMGLTAYIRLELDEEAALN